MKLKSSSLFSRRFRRKSTTLTVAILFRHLNAIGPLFVHCALFTISTWYLILNAFKASNMKCKTIPKQKGPPFHFFRHCNFGKVHKKWTDRVELTKKTSHCKSHAFSSKTPAKNGIKWLRHFCKRTFQVHDKLSNVCLFDFRLSWAIAEFRNIFTNKFSVHFSFLHIYCLSSALTLI